MRKRLWIIAAAALLQAGGAAQSIRSEDLAAGKLLVASRDLLDPNFVQTVVLLVRYSEDEDSVVGLIVNRRTQIPIARVFPELKEAKGQADPIYRGGPVERTAALALLRAGAKPEEAEHVFANVSMISNRTLLDKTIAARMDPSMFHIFLGYAGWTAQQLQGEVDLGAWHIFPGSAAVVFDTDPETLWSRLIRKTEERIALSGSAAQGVIYTDANTRSFIDRHHAARPRADRQKERSPARAEKS
jgi:putative transcriptional regulator